MYDLHLQKLNYIFEKELSRSNKLKNYISIAKVEHRNELGSIVLTQKDRKNIRLTIG